VPLKLDQGKNRREKPIDSPLTSQKDLSLTKAREQQEVVNDRRGKLGSGRARAKQGLLKKAADLTEKLGRSHRR